jgi:uncharacterized protein YhdP
MRIVFRHTAVLLIEVLAGILAIAILAGGVLAVRLKDQAPLQLSFLTPYLERALNDLDPNLKVKIGETLLTWSGWENPLDLRARNVEIRDAEGHGLATLPDIALALSVSALAQGEIAPAAIEVEGPRLLVLRTAEGRIQLGFGESEQEAAQPLPTDLAAVLLGPARGRGYLRRISVRQASVLVIDRRAGELWRLPMVNFELRRSRRGAQATAEASLTQRGATAHLKGELWVPADVGPAAVTVDAVDVDPRTLAVLAAVPEIERLRFSVGGAISALVERSGQVREVKFSLAAGPGAIDLPELYAEPLPIAAADIRGRIYDGFDKLELNGAALSILDGPTVSLFGDAAGLSSPQRITVRARLSAGAAETAAILRYWPQALGAEARNWISKNVSGGMAEEGQIDLALAVPRDDPRNAVIERAEGSFRASGLTVTYLEGLPPLQDVSGEGRLVGNILTMTVGAGRIGKLVVNRGTVEVSDLDRDPQIVTIDGDVKGPVRDALELINRDRLGYPRKMGIDPKASSGSAEAHLRFRLPAKKDVKIEEVDLRIDVKLADAALTDAAFGAAVSAGDLDMTIERDGLTMKGVAEIADTRTSLEWRENFGKAEFDTRIVAEAAPDEAARATLGLHAAPWVEGRTPVKLIYTRSGQKAMADVTADLTEASLSAEPLAWSKPPGVPGEAHALVALDGRDVVALNEVSLRAGDLVLDGSVVLGASGEALTRIALDRLAWGGSRLQGVKIELGSRIRVEIAGGVLDAEPFLEARERGGGADEEEPPPGPAFLILAPALGELRTGEDRAFAPASLELAHNGERWQSLDVTAGMPGGKTMSLHYGLDPASGHRALRLTSDDAGALLRASRLLETVIGGRLKVEGVAKEPGLSAPLPVRAEVEDYRVVRGRVMAKILQQAKLEDINQLLSQEGIPFARFTGQMVLSDEGIQIEKARAYGAALGITAQGKIDLDAGKLDIEGTIVPAYVVSQIVGGIPLIGRILTGGEGEGLFAATYRAEGSLDDPQVSVNPLAALAPGFLRGLFNIFEGGSSGNGDQDFTPLPPREAR